MDNFADFLSQVSNKFSNSTAFEIRRRIVREKVFYKDLPSIIKKVHSFFAKEGILEKETILFWGLNCPEYATLLLTCFSTNRTAVPIDFRNSEETIIAVYAQTKSKFAFVSRFLNHGFLKAHVEHIYIIEDIFEYVRELGELELTEGYKNPENTSEIVFTSGTTGQPKGVVLKQKNLLTNIGSLSEAIPKLARFEAISIMPLSHMLGQAIDLLLMLYVGGKIIYLPRVNSYRILKALQENRVTHLVFVPQLLNIFLEKIKQKAFDTGKLESFEKALKVSQHLPTALRKMLFKEIHKVFGADFKYFACGGAPLSPKTAKAWIDMGFTILEGYGATEVSAAATFNRPGNIKLGSAGTPIRGVNIKIKEDEIIIESNAVANGYYENKEKTEKVFINNSYKTGDIGYLDKNGFLFIKGREDFKIALATGEKIYVEDLENKINQHKKIKDSCVVEGKGKEGAVPVAYVILAPGSKEEELDTIFVEVNKTLESKQQIRNYKLWPAEDFPRTNTFKIDRKKVKESYESNSFEHASKERTFAPSLTIYDILANVTGIARSEITDEKGLSSDLYLNSLARLELTSQIEEYLGVIVDESKITQGTNVKDLVELIKTSKDTGSSLTVPNWQFKPFGRLINWLATRLIIFPIHSRIAKLKIVGLENIEGENLVQGFIAIFNHPGILDGTCVLRACSKVGRSKWFVPSARYFWENPKFRVVKTLMEATAGGIPLFDDGDNLRMVLKKSSDLLDEGYFMYFAPTGRLRVGDSNDPFLPGIGFIVRELKRPLIPFRIKGYEKIWPAPPSLVTAKPKDLLNIHPGEVELVIGKEIKIPDEIPTLELAHYIETEFMKL